MATIKEIAELAGVSRTTVSFVLNHNPVVNQETRNRVEKIIRETGYIPNHTAQNLSRKVTRCIGLIVLSDQKRTFSYDFDNGTGLYSLAVIRGVASALDDTEYGMLIEYYCETDTPDGLPDLFLNRKIDGALLVGGFCSRELLSRLTATGIPFCMVEVGLPEPQCDCVYSDPGAGAVSCLDRLYQAGKRKLLFLNAPSHFRSAQTRTQAVSVWRENHPDCRVEEAYPPANNGYGGFEATKQCLKAGSMDGLATANAQLALGAVRAIREAGLSIPDDVSVAVYEDNVLAGYCMPPLTAVNIQKEEMGKAAVGLLLDRIAAPGRKTCSICVPQYLVERESISDNQKEE